MKDPVLIKATRFLRRRKYDRAIKLLEPEVVNYRGSYTYYYIMGLSYLRTGIFNYAFDYFRRAHEVSRERNVPALQGLGVLHLRRGDTKRALDCYLKVQELDERNRVAKKALRVIRKYSGTEDLRGWAASTQIRGLFPPFPAEPITKSTFLVPFAWLLAAGALTYGGLIWRGVLPMPIKIDLHTTKRAGFASSALESEERQKPVEVGGSYRYVLTRDQVLSTYEQARELFNKRRDEAAKVPLNRILESNATEAVKGKARLLMSYMDEPGFDTLRDRFAYGEVKQEPALYRGCYVIWRGMATNLVREESSTSFDFLVGYDTRSTLLGIVPVKFMFSIAVNPEQPLEVLGRVTPVSTDKGLDIILEGVAVYQTALPFSGVGTTGADSDGAK
jgi:tetratricopeptide (TPR) repeat protein